MNSLLCPEEEIEYTDHQYDLFEKIIDTPLSRMKKLDISQIKEKVDDLFTYGNIDSEEKEFLLQPSSIQHVLDIFDDYYETFDEMTGFDTSASFLRDKLEILESGRKAGLTEDWII